MVERFELLEEIGAGGMGAVWKARDTETDEVVALKLVHPHLAEDPDYIARFEREVEVAQRIDSPYVVKVLGYGTRDSVPYMAMEYVEGRSLRDALRNEGPMTWDHAKPIVRQVAEALGAAHDVGVIHRDVKPSNILITADGTAKLADFGIARALDLTRLTGSSTMLGTPHYMAPEGTPSPQSDLYALGCVLFEMLTGHPPFEGESQQAVIAAHIRDEPRTSELSAGARPLAAWLLAKPPEGRPSSAAEFVRSLIDGIRPRVPRRNHLMTWPVTAGVVATLLLVATATGALALRGSEGSTTANESARIVAVSSGTVLITPTQPSTGPAILATQTRTPNQTEIPVATRTQAPMQTQVPVQPPPSHTQSPARPEAPAIVQTQPPSPTQAAPTQAPPIPTPVTSQPVLISNGAVYVGDRSKGLPAVFYGKRLAAGAQVETFIRGVSCAFSSEDKASKATAAGEWVLYIFPNAPCNPTPGAIVTFTINGKLASSSPPASWFPGGTPVDIDNGYALSTN